jgi:ribosomal protein S18 acetylase RimI-like enzyme
MILIGASFTIRPILLDDLTQTLEVYRQCEDFLALGPDPRASVEMIEKDMQISKEAGGIFCGIFDEDNHMIGIVDFIPNNFEGNPNHAFIELLMIAVSARRKGFGGEVMQLVEKEISKNPNITDILAAVQINNPNAIRFWKNIGYEIISEPILNPDGTTVYKLCKIIQKEKP